MIKLILLISILILLNGCSNRETTAANLAGNAVVARVDGNTPIRQFKMTMRSKYPTVGLNEYTLITENLERDRSRSEDVIQAKIELPHAMQTKERKDFEAILAKDFVFRADDEFFDREGYINNRVSDPSKVKQADYQNVAVQFIDRRALITYSNIVEDQPGGLGAWKAEMTWADVFILEDNRWKCEIIHLIAFKDLTTIAQ